MNECVICLQPLATEGAHAICSLPCGHVIGQSCGLELLKRSKKCPYCSKAASARQLKRLYLPSTNFENPIGDDLQAENEKLKKRLEELQNKLSTESPTAPVVLSQPPQAAPRTPMRFAVRSARIIPRALPLKSTPNFFSLRQVARLEGTFARCGVFDGPGNFYFCSQTDPASIQIFDKSTFRILAWSPILAGCRNLRISETQAVPGKIEMTINAWGHSGSIVVGPRHDVIASNAPVLLSAEIGGVEIFCDSRGNLFLGDKNIHQFESHLLPHSLLAFPDSAIFLVLSRNSVFKILINDGDAEISELSLFPKNSVSAAVVKNSKKKFIVNFREAQSYLQIFGVSESGVVPGPKMSGHKNAFILARPAACEITPGKIIVIMLDEGRGFCAWQLEDMGDAARPLWVMAPGTADIFHSDIWRGAEEVVFATVGPSLVCVYTLPLE